jgi:hypothetical protein
MLRVIAIVPGNENEPAKLCVRKLAMASLPARDVHEASSFQVADQLTNLTRHMQ